MSISLYVFIYSLQSLYLYGIVIAYNRNQCVCVFVFNMYLLIKHEVRVFICINNQCFLFVCLLVI